VIPLNIAKAITRIWDLGEPVISEKIHLDLHVQIDEEDEVVYVETASTCSAIQLFFDMSLLTDPSVVASISDFLIPEKEVRKYVKNKGKYTMEFEPFNEDAYRWKNVNEALHRSNVVRHPEGVQMPPVSGVRINNLIHIGRVFEDLYDDDDRTQVIKISQEGPLDVIHLHVDIESQDTTIDCSVYVMPCRLGDPDEK
jgi:hypothetical protein